MDFQIGEWVVHCTRGLGQVLAIEEQTINNKTGLYYKIQLADLTIWVLADESQNGRLRFPTSEAKFRKILSILTGPADPFIRDRYQRNLQLMEILKDGRVESLCRVLRNLSAHRHSHNWSEYDSALLDRVRKTLIGEWSFSLSITPLDAETELQRLLSARLERTNP
jgi:RNA polymerase-interacting CarD/CdnL/TRCF family regulator